MALLVPEVSSGLVVATPENSWTKAPTGSSEAVMVTVMLVVPDPPLLLTPYQSSLLPTEVEFLVGPRVQVTPPPETDETVATVEAAAPATVRTRASPAERAGGSVRQAAQSGRTHADRSSWPAPSPIRL